MTTFPNDMYDTYFNVIFDLVKKMFFVENTLFSRKMPQAANIYPK